MLPKEIWNKERNAFALFCGIIASLIPNNKSNIHPVLMGIILSILFTKIVFGDYDRGYTWSVNDIYFVVVVGSLGAVGSWIFTQLIQ